MTDAQTVQKIEWLQQSFVVEYPELKENLSNLSIDTSDTVFIKSQITFEKYQEQPKLLDCHLGELLKIVTTKLASHIDVPLFRKLAKSDSVDNEHVPLVLFIQKCFSLIYVISRVRGYKAILKYFPHDVGKVEELEVLLKFFTMPVSQAYSILRKGVEDENFSTVTSTSANGQINRFACKSTFDSEPWHVECAGGLWLSIAILAPFHLSILDSGEEEERIEERIRVWCQSGIVDGFREGSPTLVSSITLLSKLLARPDMENQLSMFLHWALCLLNRKTNENFHAIESIAKILPTSSATSIQKTNILLSVASIYKSVPRKILLKYAGLLNEILDVTVIMKGGVHLRKAVMKVTGRTGTAFLAPIMHQTWHAQRKFANLKANLSGNPTTISAPATNESEVKDIEIGEQEEEIAAKATDVLLNGVRDYDTQVRWTSARQLSYLAARLPKDFVAQIIDSVVELFSPLEEDASWHGGFLLLAEMARKGILIEEKLQQVIKATVSGLVYDVKRGTSSRGAHVRDAACYVTWSFARSFRPEILENYMDTICKTLVIMSVFDREVNCRRAASAAFQENVGRQGGPQSAHIPFGLQILNIADYFVLGNRRDCYLSIAHQIATFAPYQQPLINHLLEKKYNHWDIAIRQLTAEALGNLTSLNPEYFVQSVLPKLYPSALCNVVESRHGSLLSIAAIIKALADVDYQVPEEEQKNIVGVIIDIEKHRLFRGKGGEMVRLAVCELIKSISFANYSLSAFLSTFPTHLASTRLPGKGAGQKKSARALLQEILDENVRHPKEDVQFEAIRSYKVFASKYHAHKTPKGKAILLTMLDGYITEVRADPNLAVRRGCALALGALASSTLELKLPEIIDVLISAATISKKKDENDAELRRNALESLLEITKTVPLITLGSHAVAQIFDLFMHSLDDYSVDNRGDIGSWIREVAAIGLAQLAILFSMHDEDHPTDSPIFTEQRCLQLFNGLIKQSVEKIDKMRDITAGLISFLLYNQEESILATKACYSIQFNQQYSKFTLSQQYPFRPVVIPFVKWREILESIYTRDHAIRGNIRYSAATSQTIFERTLPLFSLDEYRFSYLSGICTSIGGLSKQVSLESSKSLINHLTKGLEENKFSRTFIAAAFVHVGLQNRGKDHIIIPFFRAMFILLSNQILDNLNPPEDSFSVELVTLISEEMKGCKDIRKLFEVVDVLVGLLPFNQPTRSMALDCFIKLLANPYPKVRQLAAEQLYMGLITHEKALQTIPEANHAPFLELISSTVWETDTNFVGSANQLATLLQ